MWKIIKIVKKMLHVYNNIARHILYIVSFTNLQLYEYMSSIEKKNPVDRMVPIEICNSKCDNK